MGAWSSANWLPADWSRWNRAEQRERRIGVYFGNGHDLKIERHPRQGVCSAHSAVRPQWDVVPRAPGSLGDDLILKVFAMLLVNWSPH